MGRLFPYRHSDISRKELVTLVKIRKSFHITMKQWERFQKLMWPSARKQCQYYIYYHAIAYNKKPAEVAMCSFLPDGRLRPH